MHLQSYRLRMKTAIETLEQSNSNQFVIYFKGERGLTQSLIIPLNKLREEIYESTFESIDVGNLILVHVKLDANNVRWKLDWIELERDDRTVLKFPIYRWLDSERNQKIDVMIKEGPAQLAPIYTIIVHTGTISNSLQAKISLALIGDGASTLPFDLNSTTSLIDCSAKDLFQSGSNERISISPLETVDVGRLFYIQLWCDSEDKLPYYCESIEVMNHSNNHKYFFLVNHWFGPNLEQFVSVPIIDRHEESNVYTIAVKTTDISDSNAEKMVVRIHIKFANGKSYKDALSLSETHRIPFQKENTDFFMITVDGIGDTEIVNIKLCLINKTTSMQWNCAWIEIRDIFYQRNYCYIPPKTLVSIIDKEPYEYTNLQRITDLPCSKNNTRPF